MNSLYIGQSASGKTSNIKKRIANLDGKVIILDFNNQYEDTASVPFYLDDISPILGLISLDDAKALNAGYIHNTHCLYKKCAEVLRESKSTEKMNLIEEAVERLHISWDNTEMAYAKILSQKIPMKKNKKQASLDETIETILNHDVVSLKAKSMHSDHLRAVTFALISRMSRKFDEKVYIVADDLSSFFNNGNLKLLFSTINMDNIQFILSFNKMMNIPKALIPLIDTFYVHRFENNADIKDLKILGILPSKPVKKLSIGEYCEMPAKTNQEVL